MQMLIQYNNIFYKKEMSRHREDAMRQQRQSCMGKAANQEWQDCWPPALQKTERASKRAHGPADPLISNF